MWITRREFEERIAALQQAPLPECPHCGPLKGRIEDLEIWRGKIHAMMIEKTPKGQDKLTRFGRFVAGQKTH